LRDESTNSTVFSFGGGELNLSVLANFNAFVTSPSFRPTGITTASGNGVFLPTTDTLGFSTNGVEKMRIASNGRVGIGTSTLTGILNIKQSGAELSIQTDANNVYFEGINRDNTALNVDYGFYARNGAHKFWTGSYTERMRLTNDGNVGIGTSTPAAGLTIAKFGTQWVSGSSINWFQPAGNIGLSILPTASNQDNWFGMIGDYNTNTGSVNLLLQANFRDVGSQAGHYISSKAISFGNADFEIGKIVTTTSVNTPPNKVPQFYIIAGGNVGIGTTSPGTKMQVIGTISAQNNVDGSDATGIRIYGSGTSKRIDFVTSDASVNERISGIGTGGVGTMTFSVNNDVATLTERMRITSAGNVGIGNTASTSGYKLQVSGLQRMIGSSTVLNFGELDSNNNYFQSLGTDGSTAKGFIFYGSGEYMRITSGGNVGIGRTPTTNILEINGDASKTIVGSWLANSDSTIKTEIHTIDGALDRVNKVRLVSFKYKDEYKLLNPSIKDKFYQNVIAQEFQKIYPDYVYESGDIFEGKNILQVDTNPMYIDAISSIQELSILVQEQNQIINNLESRLQALENN
jgi:hypothetical protein